jgi:hypothetical protein
MCVNSIKPFVRKKRSALTRAVVSRPVFGDPHWANETSFLQGNDKKIIYVKCDLVSCELIVMTIVSCTKNITSLYIENE